MVEEEVRDEVDAVLSVYGDDCEVIEAYPPNLRVHLKPRTADVSAQQFVEATIEIRASPQYPEEPPDISVIDSKGFDDQRQKLIIASIRNRSFELAPGLMLVALCEEAVEQLSSMNHPDGDCPICLHPLLDQNAGSDSQAFMKLMSCFHCFHCDCIIEWWNWIQMQKTTEIKGSSSSPSMRSLQDQQGMRKMMEGSTGNCPVCRKVFLSKDFEHIVDLVGSYHHRDTDTIAIHDDILQSDFEKIRRQKYESALKLQHENGGLIVPKANEVLLPGMYLPPAPALHSTESSIVSNEPQQAVPAGNSDTHPESSLSRPGPMKHSNSNMRKYRPKNTRKQGSVWCKKDNGPGR